MATNKLNVDNVSNNLFILTGQEDERTPYDWDDEAYAKITVRIRDQEDLDEFIKLMGQTITPKTKAIWYPALDKKRNSLLRWMDEDDESRVE